MSFTRELNILNISGLALMAIICVFLSVFFMNRSASGNIENIRKLVTEERMNQLKDQVANAYAVIETASFYEEAQKSISEMRFGDKKQNSFYVVDGDGMYFVNIPDPAYVGKVKMSEKDADGKEYVKEIIKSAKDKGEGFASYRELQPGSSSALNKMVYYRYFSNWNWVVYAAINTSDIDGKLAQVEDNIKSTLLTQVAILVVVSGILLAIVIFLNTKLVATRIIGPIKELTSAAEEMSLGNYDRMIDIRCNTEIQSLSDSIERLRASLFIAMKKLKEKPRSEREYDLAG